jgi:hypothetical protein
MERKEGTARKEGRKDMMGRKEGMKDTEREHGR